ncbi:ATP-binding cassette domain-containing protein [Conexibacter sp. JD483]|uniref:ATP-binding cassette domain-containing protein n=1 Tax=unclassified Conexibacter TaxID=2627773 RepID=UPI0027175492|nr:MULTISPECIES: ATP-binding cassette domain-containing protein [unclassified Conexibacter]MDO8184615.1 ATP-binding cassette domain-containing protein [Conexibacter sp. CPCC 205706]MDO8197921.1 ATP-binding cassette domain-containing protein [Conexibacter sp. CPCC 205762]MDR9370114.1 ATP-binding cassette domain-containing protein [Conexibacter sp. JD483]
MIDVTDLTKRYGDRLAVDALSFRVEPGRVTGFLGPNGAGKSTTMRMIVGLDAPTAGTARVDGRAYRDHRAPLREVGVLLEAHAIHPGRSARDHLRALAATHAIPHARVEQVIDLVGLRQVAGKRAGAFSLGMGQRLGIAAALLGDPGTVILDEPVNGLDPEGVLWVRTLLRGLAAEGRTIFLSSHLMSEMALTADHLIVVGRGRLIADLPVEELTRRAASDRVLVRTPDATTLRERLAGPGVAVASGARDELEVSGLTSAQIGTVARDHGLTLHELTPQRATLEEAFMELTRDAVEYEAVAA